MGFDVNLSGPLFDGTAGGIIDQAIEAITSELVNTAHDAVFSFFEEFKSHPTWQWEHQLTGLVIDAGHGIIYDPVPYTAWLEGVTSRNQTTRFKGYHMWQQSAAWMQALAPAMAAAVLSDWMPLLGGNLPYPGPATPRYRGGRSTNPNQAYPGWVPWTNSKFMHGRHRTFTGWVPYSHSKYDHD